MLSRLTTLRIVLVQFAAAGTLRSRQPEDVVVLPQFFFPLLLGFDDLLERGHRVVFLVLLAFAVPIGIVREKASEER